MGDRVLGEEIREAFETRYAGYRWWLENQGEQHPALGRSEA